MGWLFTNAADLDLLEEFVYRQAGFVNDGAVAIFGGKGSPCSR